MKELSTSIALGAIILLAHAVALNGKKLTITWSYGSGQIASWRAVGINQWGGYDYSCHGPFNGCQKYDWMTNYYYDIQPPNLPPQSYSADYPNDLRVSAMQQDGQSPPTSLPTPTVTQTVED